MERRWPHLARRAGLLSAAFLLLLPGKAPCDGGCGPDHSILSARSNFFKKNVMLLLLKYNVYAK